MNSGPERRFLFRTMVSSAQISPANPSAEKCLVNDTKGSVDGDWTPEMIDQMKEVVMEVTVRLSILTVGVGDDWVIQNGWREKETIPNKFEQNQRFKYYGKNKI